MYLYGIWVEGLIKCATRKTNTYVLPEKIFSAVSFPNSEKCFPESGEFMR